MQIAVNNMGGADANEKVDEFINTAIEWFLDESTTNEAHHARTGECIIRDRALTSDEWATDWMCLQCSLCLIVHTEDQIYWDDVEGWLQEVLSEEFHIDAQDGSPEQVRQSQAALTVVEWRLDATSLLAVGPALNLIRPCVLLLPSRWVVFCALCTRTCSRTRTSPVCTR